MMKTTLNISLIELYWLYINRFWTVGLQYEMLILHIQLLPKCEDQLV